ncbi:MAG TPA: hypothetical protein VIK34_04785 [Clostridiaceae bacterium]
MVMVSDLYMTVFYSKSTGIITNCCTGVQDMSFYRNLQADYEQIFELVVFNRDDFADRGDAVLANPSAFTINLETKTLKIKAEFVPQYPIG